MTKRNSTEFWSAVGFSLGIHLLLLIFIGIFALLSLSSFPLAGRGGRGVSTVSVDIVGEHGRNSSWKIPVVPPEKNRKKSSTPHEASHSLSAGEGLGQGGPGANSGPEGGTSMVLSRIRERIERAKRYPLVAERSGVQGKSLVHFRIDEKGQPQEIFLKTGSGSAILDQEAQESIRRAAPYPAYEGTLEVWIHFELSE